MRAEVQEKPRAPHIPECPEMSDLIFLVIGLGFFVAGSLYLFACDRL
jgi:hypothetical protein